MPVTTEDVLLADNVGELARETLEKLKALRDKSKPDSGILGYIAIIDPPSKDMQFIEGIRGTVFIDKLSGEQLFVVCGRLIASVLEKSWEITRTGTAVDAMLKPITLDQAMRRIMKYVEFFLNDDTMRAALM